MENGTGANTAVEQSQGARHPESEETPTPGEIMEGEQKEGAERMGPPLPFNIPGMGDMAVSNSIGSKVFDILLGLGVSWMLRTLVLNYGSVVVINSKGIVYSVILLLVSVSLMVLGIRWNGWKLNRRLGVGALLLYAVSLCFSILIELNVFLEVNLPSCQ